jgi:hypothetical protein
MADIILDGKAVGPAVKKFRQRFLQMRYCFSDDSMEEMMERLTRLI